MDTNQSIAEHGTFVKPFFSLFAGYLAYIHAKRTFAKLQALQQKIPVYCRFCGRIFAVLHSFRKNGTLFGVKAGK
jgi:hypothetical protein